jgi:bifunctional non-homologous end joining protein LigD
MKPMLATVGTEDVLDRKDYLFEPKLDGIRALCYKKTKLKFTSRNGLVITDKYPEFRFYDNLDAEECILDGEIVVYDEKGHPSFSLWMERSKGAPHTATYVAFDIIYLNGNSLLNEPLYRRKKILEQVVKEGDHLQTSFYTKKGRELWNKIRELGVEGIIAKKNDSSYELGVRSDSWQKIKITKDIDCAILGYTTEKRKLSSLALGFWDGEKFVFAGKVGTGFDEKTMDELTQQLDGITLESAAIETEKDVIPVEPILVAQINYLEVTANNKLRAPVFVRLREDKDPQDCVLPEKF